MEKPCMLWDFDEFVVIFFFQWELCGEKDANGALTLTH